MEDRDVIDAEYRVVEPRYPWRIRFWPSVMFWVYLTGVFGAARKALPNSDPGTIAAIVLMAACVSPIIRAMSAMFSALTGGDLVGEAEAEQLRRHLSGRERARD